MRLALSAILSIVGFCQVVTAANFPPVNDGGVMFAAATNDVVPTDRVNEPFDSLHVRAPEGPLWVKFRDLRSLVRAEVVTARNCRQNPDKCQPSWIPYGAIIDKARTQDGRDRIETVNRGVNSALKFQSDYSQYRQMDKWVSPLATFQSGRGDCEDFATAKFVALRAAGTPFEDLWLVLGFDKAIRQHHMVPVVRLEGRWLVLENRTMVMFEDKDYPNFDPLFLINHEGVREFRRATTFLRLRVCLAAAKNEADC